MITLVVGCILLAMGIIGGGFLLWACITNYIEKDDQLNYCFGALISYLVLLMVMVAIAMAEKQYLMNN
ncbi:hypothetical protein MZD04_gp307 [Pseudomonas phage Psa21]|uniref:Uncharacterized protein n=1 Tax=Pseudomonas phage Psa21 TaxID=2530023 RepID=A0A481W619_9CAUD|nr:hypothetical protein MZD04_gp307 [Pseudomonas phage Psa21]QBJ02833.1 hypothetical protein PSA21_307 [Pseudomonas phage Psa21]